MEKTVQDRIDEYSGLLYLLNQEFRNSEASAIAVMQEIGRDRRMEDMQASASRNSPGQPQGSDGNSGSVLATDKQRNFYRRLTGDELPERISKREASERIDDAMGSSEEGAQ